MIKHKEIILVRVLGSDLESVLKEVNKILLEFNTEENPITSELYRSLSLPTDISVNIDYYEPKKRNIRHAICQRLAEMLKEVGFINHSVWTMEA